MPKTNERLLIVVLLVTQLAHVLDFVIMMPLGPKLMRELAISAADFGHIVSLYTFAAAFSSFFGAFWIDRVNRRSALLFLMLGFIMGNLACAWSPSVVILMVGRAVAGVFGGVMGAVVYSLIGQVISMERRGRASGVLGTAFPIVSIAGVPIGLKIADTLGWRSSFGLVVILSLLSFVLISFVVPSIKPETTEEDESPIDHVKEVIKYKPHRLGVFAMVLAVLGGFTIVPYIAPFLVNNEYIKEDQLYLIYLVGGSCAIISSRLVGIWSDKRGKITLLRVMCILTIAALAIFTNLPKVPLTLVIASMSFAMMALPGRFVSLMAWLTVISKPQLRGAFMSLVATIQQLTIGIAAIIGGFLVGESESGTIETYWLAGIFAISANILILIVSPKLKKAEEEAEQQDAAKAA